LRVIDVSADDVEPPDWTPDVKAAARAVLDALSVTEYEVSILFCSDSRMRDLNSTYRGIAEPTDVLSFSQDEGDRIPSSGPDCLRGDVVVSLESVRRNAAQLDIEPAEEALRVAVHGILHLAGYEHAGVSLADPGAADHPMLSLQERIVHELVKEQNK
jgi:probable rRNA maturation factor